MALGSFGSIVFEVSMEKVLTWSSLKRSGKGGYAEHKVLKAKPKLQFTGPELEEISLSIRLSAGLGVDPVAAASELRALRDSGAYQVLTIGSQVFGRFVLEEISEEHRRHDKHGDPWIVDVELKLREYWLDEQLPVSGERLSKARNLLAVEVGTPRLQAAQSAPSFGDVGGNPGLGRVGSSVRDVAPGMSGTLSSPDRDVSLAAGGVMGSFLGTGLNPAAMLARIGASSVRSALPKLDDLVLGRLSGSMSTASTRLAGRPGAAEGLVGSLLGGQADSGAIMRRALSSDVRKLANADLSTCLPGLPAWQRASLSGALKGMGDAFGKSLNNRLASRG